jgi:hypothetical protein
MDARVKRCGVQCATDGRPKGLLQRPLQTRCGLHSGEASEGYENTPKKAVGYYPT